MIRKAVIVVALVLLIAPLAFAAYEFYLGAITNIQPTSVTIKNDAGQIRTFQLSTQPPQGLKVGDKVKVKVLDGKITAWDWGMAPISNGNKSYPVPVRR